jgi:hypothetical protein
MTIIIMANALASQIFNIAVAAKLYLIRLVISYKYIGQEKFEQMVFGLMSF